jgi:hypothetical protein
MFICGLGARRQIGLLLRGGMCAAKFQEIFHAANCPHGDTLNNAFADKDPAESQRLVCWMVYCLIRKKVMYPSATKIIVDKFAWTGILKPWEKHSFSSKEASLALLETDEGSEGCSCSNEPPNDQSEFQSSWRYRALCISPSDAQICPGGRGLTYHDAAWNSAN